MLKVEKLVKDYTSGFFRKTVRVLEDVSFSVNDGEIYGFIGPNGAGKTTTFKTILGFANITSGTVEIMGKPFADVDWKKLVGYLPENPYFYDYLTGEELLRYMGELHSIDSQTLKSRIGDLLDKVKMTHAAKTQLRKYSKGMLQRIGIAQALINDPEFIIMDEPMSGLDPIGQKEVKDLIHELKQRGKTILMSTHILTNVEALCDRVGVISRGRVVKEGALADLLKEIGAGYELYLDTADTSVLNRFDGLEISHEVRAGMVVLKFDEKIKSQVMGRVLELDLDVVSLDPHRKSLESLFVEETINS